MFEWKRGVDQLFQCRRSFLAATAATAGAGGLAHGRAELCYYPSAGQHHGCNDFAGSMGRGVGRGAGWVGAGSRLTILFTPKLLLLKTITRMGSVLTNAVMFTQIGQPANLFWNRFVYLGTDRFVYLATDRFISSFLL